jgi:methionyl aminopeptidase
MVSRLREADLAAMQKAGKTAAVILRDLESFIKPRISTKDIERFFDNALAKYAGMSAAFKGYNRFPASVCVSLNDEVIHGIPSDTRIVKNGDLVSVDLGIKYKGVYVDTACTYMVGEVSELARTLCRVTKEALWEGIKQALPGARVGDVGSVVQNLAEKNGFSVVRQFVGHGIGRDLHLPPEVPNFGKKKVGFEFKENIALAIEPMVAVGGYEVVIDNDGWTARTKDGSLSAHYEHTVVVTKNGPLVITV